MTRARVIAAVLAAALAAAFLASAGPAAAVHRPGAATPFTPLRGWGQNSEAELGNGTTQIASLPVKVKLPKGVTITQVRAGCRHAVALTSAGHVYYWGQFADGTTVIRKTPVRMKLPSGVKATAVRAGCSDILALTSTGRVYAQGYNSVGELGDGTHRNRHTPVRVKLPKGTKIKAISTGCSHALAITASGGVLAWGADDQGQLGNGTSTSADKDRPVHVKLPPGAKATIIAAGCSHSFALTSAGLYGWGLNNRGQLGDSTTTSRSTPERITFLIRGQPLGKLVSLFAGCYQTYALYAKGALLAWGYNEFGELGNGSTADSDQPVRVQLPAETQVKTISAGCDQGYALTRSGQVLAWGVNFEGELGNGTLTSASTPAAVKLPAGLTATGVFSGVAAQHAFALVRRS
jgi:alpha-tubulin suppressor-like RCC1 family protein